MKTNAKFTFEDIQNVSLLSDVTNKLAGWVGQGYGLGTELC